MGKRFHLLDTNFGIDESLEFGTNIGLQQTDESGILIRPSEAPTATFVDNLSDVVNGCTLY